MITKREARQYLEGLDSGLVSWVHEPKGRPAQMRNQPDILACVNGRFVALKLMRFERRPPVGVRKVLAEIEDKGGVVGAVSSMLELEKLVMDLRFGSPEEINLIVRHKRLKEAWEDIQAHAA